jgi:hypothetical protein
MAVCRGDVVEHHRNKAKRKGRTPRNARRSLWPSFVPNSLAMWQLGTFARTVTPTPPLVSAFLSSSLLLLEKTGISSFTMADNSSSGACTLTSCTRVAKEAIAFAIFQNQCRLRMLISLLVSLSIRCLMHFSCCDLLFHSFSYVSSSVFSSCAFLSSPSLPVRHRPIAPSVLLQLYAELPCPASMPELDGVVLQYPIVPVSTLPPDEFEEVRRHS